MLIKYSILLFIIAIIGLTSCKNNDNVVKPVLPTNITVVNVSADTLNFYLNGTRQNNLTSLYPGGSSGYMTVPAGLQNYQFKKAGNTAILFSDPLNLTDSTYNSLFITGESADKAIKLTDALVADTILSTIRFVNAAPDAGNLNAAVDSLPFNALAFKSSSAFLKIGSGQKEIRIYVAGLTTPRIDTTITLQPRRIYTLFAKGLLNGRGASVFDVGVLLNQ